MSGIQGIRGGRGGGSGEVEEVEAEAGKKTKRKKEREKAPFDVDVTGSDRNPEPVRFTNSFHNPAQPPASSLQPPASSLQPPASLLIARRARAISSRIYHIICAQHDDVNKTAPIHRLQRTKFHARPLVRYQYTTEPPVHRLHTHTLRTLPPPPPWHQVSVQPSMVSRPPSR